MKKWTVIARAFLGEPLKRVLVDVTGRSAWQTPIILRRSIPATPCPLGSRSKMCMSLILLHFPNYVKNGCKSGQHRITCGSDYGDFVGKLVGVYP
jgi:hypothetical protein